MGNGIRKSSIVAALVLLVGLVLHGFGLSYDEADEQTATHLLAAGFDVVAAGVVLLRDKLGGRGGVAAGGRARLLVAMALSPAAAVACLGGAGGCAVFAPNPNQTPADRVSELRQDFNLVLRALILARMEGLIDNELYARIDKYRRLAEGALDSLAADAEAGRDIDLSAAKRAFVNALDQLILYQQEVERDGPGNDSGADPGGAVSDPNDSGHVEPGGGDDPGAT